MGKWFRGLQEIAEKYPELYPHGIIPGVLLHIAPEVVVAPSIAPTVPDEVAADIMKLHQRLF